MAQFCARVRKRDDLPSVSMRDVYGHPTIRALAAALAEAPRRRPGPRHGPPNRPRHRAAPPAMCCAESLQFLVFAVYCLGAGIATAAGYSWISGGEASLSVYLRSLVFGGALFLGMCTLPVVAKWVLVGRWKETEFPVWGLAYVRFWTVKALLHANPMILFTGNPLYVLYLRALGARIGPGVTILSHSVPVCTDLLTVGAGTVIRKDALFLGYRAHAGRIRTGPVTLGRDVFVGEKTVLDIGTSIGNGGQLGHSSALYDGAAVPAGQRWHGSPARRTDVDHIRVPAARCTTAAPLRLRPGGAAADPAACTSRSAIGGAYPGAGPRTGAGPAARTERAGPGVGGLLRRGAGPVRRPLRRLPGPRASSP